MAQGFYRFPCLAVSEGMRNHSPEQSEALTQCNRKVELDFAQLSEGLSELIAKTLLLLVL